MPPRLLPLLGALLLSSSLAQTPASQAPAASPERELLERAATPFWSPASVRVGVLVGQAPADLGFALPQGSRMVGSVLTETADPDFPAGVTVYFDSRLTPGQVQAHFARVLPTAGWKVLTVGNDGPSLEFGFVSSTPIGGRPYYHENPDQSLNILTRVVGGVTQVRLSRERAPSLRQQLRFAQAGGPGRSPFSQLPKLRAPEGASVTPRGGGSSGDDVTQTAGIESQLSRTALFDHYAAQLRQAGWTLRNRADTGTLTTSIWTFQHEGKERVGLLLLSETGKGQYRATLGTQGLE